MKEKTSHESFLAVARLAAEHAEAEDRELDEIQKHIEAGEDADALSGMREFFRHHRKPPDREQGYDRENRKARGVGASA